MHSANAVCKQRLASRNVVVRGCRSLMMKSACVGDCMGLIDLGKCVQFVSQSAEKRPVEVPRQRFAGRIGVRPNSILRLRDQ
ncbi:MAG: hypothetical protein R3C56_03650 [Pirellulaceae bacterium]